MARETAGESGFLGMCFKFIAICAIVFDAVKALLSLDICMSSKTCDLCDSCLAKVN